MKKLIVSTVALLFCACLPPAPSELQIPTNASIEGKSYRQLIETTKIEAALGPQIIEARLVTPEIAKVSIIEIGKEKNFTEDEMEFHKKNTIERDEIICQVQFKSVGKEGAKPENWKYSIVDDQGKTAEGKPKNISKPSGGAISSTGQTTYQQSAQILFDGYKIDDARKVTIKFTYTGEDRAAELTWILPTDHVKPAGGAPGAPTPPATESTSQPAASQ